MVSRCPISNAPGWPEVALAEITTKVGSGATPRGGAETYLDKRVEFALIRSQNVFDRYFDSDGLAYITNEQAENLRNAQVQQGDILLNITGDGITFGRACMAPEFILPACVNQHVSIIRVDKTRAEAGFLLAFLTHPDVKSYIESFNAGGSRRAITKGHIESFRLPLPPLNYQHVVAHVLGTIDDKIELNRKTNETLEEMARALFQSWFVDFDPVRAKAEGRAPSGMDAATAALFPGEFVESEQGKIPKGWRCAPLSNWVATLSGGTPSKNDPSLWNGTLPWISPKVMTAIHADQAEAFVTASAIGNGTRLAPAGATLVMVRGMGLHQEVRVSQARRELTFNQDVKALVPEKIAPSLLLFAMLHAQRDLLGRVETSGHGTGKLPSEILLGQRLVMPPLAVQPLLAKPFDMLNDRIAVLRSESVQLTSLRDELLPRLLSGGLTVELERGSRAYERDS